MSLVPVSKSGVPEWAHYRESEAAGVSCGTCDFFLNGRCEMFDYTPVAEDYVCDRWAGQIEKDEPLYTGVSPDRKPAGSNPQALIDLIGALEPARKAESGKLLLISHAKTRYNKPGQPHDIVQGWRDIPLDAQGRVQARKLGNFLKSAEVETIYTSSLVRAEQTAKIAGRVAGVKVVSDGAFRPWNLGDFAGHSSSDVVPKLKPYIDDPSKKVSGGESFNEYQKRFLPALEKLLKMVEQGHTIALVTHSRNLEAVEGWLGGSGHRKKVDSRAIESDQIDPSTVVEISSKRGKLSYGKEINVSKAQAYSAEMNLRVHGMSRTADGQLSYRMITRDNHYVGRTNPTKHRARKGEVLRVQANHFAQDDNGNLRWINPNVIGHESDVPHSLKEIEALAGGTLAKDGADGPAGDLPAAGDEGNAAGALQANQVGALAATVGPTISDVHVNVPLRNVSQAYVGKRRLKVQKTDKQKQIVYGVVLEPETLDSQDDYMLPDQVEKAAHTYLKKVARGKASVSKLQHRKQGFFKNKPGVVPVESFIAPLDFSYDGKEMIKKGTWVLALHVEDPAVWEDVLSGVYTGLSIGGTGIRQSMHYPPAGAEGLVEAPPASEWFKRR